MQTCHRVDESRFDVDDAKRSLASRFVSDIALIIAAYGAIGASRSYHWCCGQIDVHEHELLMMKHVA